MYKIMILQQVVNLFFTVRDAWVRQDVISWTDHIQGVHSA
jgi:hypothetical protein